MGNGRFLIQSMEVMSGNLDDCFYFDRCVERQARNTNSRAGMFARIAENRHEEIGSAIGHKVLFHKIGRGGYEGGNLHNAFDAAKIAKSSFCLGKDVDSASTRRSLSVRYRQLITDLTRMHKLAAFQRKLARCEKQRTALRKGT